MEEKAKLLIEKFKEDCAKEGVVISPGIRLKPVVAEGMTERETKLVASVVSVYLAPSFDIKPLVDLTPSETLEDVQQQ